MSPNKEEIEDGKSNPVQVFNGASGGRKFATDEMWVIKSAISLSGKIHQMNNSKIPIKYFESKAKVRNNWYLW